MSVQIFFNFLKNMLKNKLKQGCGQKCHANWQVMAAISLMQKM